MWLPRIWLDMFLHKVDSLSQELDKRGFRCWYDNRMESLTREAMAEGVQDSCFVILFLSGGVLERPFVRFTERCGPVVL